MAIRAKPLSPHLQIYRWQYSNTLSILNRLTGVALSIGLVLFIYWLVAIASGAEAYEAAVPVFVHPVTRLLLIAWTFSFFFHLLNGFRHLAWDVGYGFDKKVARATGWACFICALLFTALYWGVLASRLGGAA
jgi:succinate dehydrogenase / fumarate reductase cytochrome b subunit